MNILLLGNGFDLAHKRPTKYKDFIYFCCALEKIYSYAGDVKLSEYKEKCKEFEYLNPHLKSLLINAYEGRKCERIIKDDGTYKDKIIGLDNSFDELHGMLIDNAWFEYFKNCDSLGEGWIDFESEIAKIINVLNELKNNREKSLGDDSLLYSQLELAQMLINYDSWEGLSELGYYDNYTFVTRLEKDLDRIIRALEIYLARILCYVPEDFKLKEITDLEISRVLSFNYTDTFYRLYDENKDIKYCYIHGKAKGLSTVDTCNMVLGINEFLPDELADKDMTFVYFKKYYQRIYKSTGAEYLEWVEEIQQDLWKEKMHLSTLYEQDKFFDIERLKNREYTRVSNLYIFGHSLDVTDKDVLKALICNDNVQTHIFYYRETHDDRRTLKKLVANLAKVIGPEELIRRTGGPDKTIEFIPQTVES